MKCRKCGSGFTPTENKIKKKDYVCGPCHNAACRFYRKTKHLREKTVAPLERYQPVPESGCWLFDGAWSHKAGYGQLTLNGVNEGAHRQFYRGYKGDIPDGMFVCHKCDTPQCVNPDHLFLGDIQANNRDRSLKGRASGEGNGRAKLKRKDVIDIRSKASVETRGSLAERYVVCKGSIQDIISRKTWTHI